MSSSPHLPGRDHLPPPRLEEVAEDVYAYVQPDGSWWINNTGLVSRRAASLAIDTCSTERRTRRFFEAIEPVTASPPGILVNTHHHGDHTNGNCLLTGATVIGHHRCREEIVTTGIVDPGGLFDPVEWGELVPVAPSVTFDDRLTVWVDDLRVELHHLTSAAHTTNDVVVWIPARRVMFTGDLVFNGGTPFVLMGSVSGSLEALDRLVEFDADVLVPGHGPPCTVEEVDVVGEYLRFVQITAEHGVKAGLTPGEAARQADLGMFADLSDPERLVGNLHRAYAELAGARPGAPIDVVAAFADMVAFNGGRPLRCLA